jgi:ribosomal protein L11 methyltransferase
MPWVQIAVDTSRKAAIRVAQLLERAGALALTFSDAAGQPCLEPGPGETPLWEHTRVLGLFAADVDVDLLAALLRSQFPGLASLGAVRTERIADQPWERVWLERFQPMRFGTRLWVCPHGQPVSDPQAIVLRLDPGLAFGTGTHPSTALCLEWLASAEMLDRRIVDYGCGSGILGIAAALLGAGEVWALDHDPQALLATQENARRNRVENRIRVITPAELPSSPRDIVLANILAGPLIELAERLCSLTRAGGDLVLSGILAQQSASVLSTYQGWLGLHGQTERDGWVRLHLRKKSPDLVP